MHYGQYTARLNDETISGDWTFSASNTPQYNEAPSFTSGSLELITNAHAEGLANQGAATSTEIQSGIVELGSSAELGLGNATGSTGGSLVLQNRFATTTPYATSSIPVTDSTGKLNQGFIDLTEDFTITGDFTVASSTNIGTTTQQGPLIVNNISTFNATVTFNNATTTFEMGVILGNATPTDPKHAASKEYVDTSGYVFASTTVYNGSAPTSWTDLDLSSDVGSNNAMINLEIQYVAGDEYSFRRNGRDNNVATSSTSFDFSNVNFCSGNDSLGVTSTCSVVVNTDSGGIVEWIATSGNYVAILLESYFK